jgi:hypothetical protein
MNADRQADVEYWGLTWREQVDYFGRVSAYYGRKARAHGEESVRLSRIASRWAGANVVVLGLLVLVLLLKAIG